MNIVIVGDGKVGYALADQLGREGHDITVIDKNPSALRHTVEVLDVMGVHGNGASPAIQKEAGVHEADLLIAATSTDELNMLCCLTAKSLGAKNTIARVRDPEYMDQMRMLQEQFGLSLVINPELETAREIARVIRFPTALKVDTFARGRVELVEYKLQEDSAIAGLKLMDLPRITDNKVLICAVDRGGEVYIPGGSFVLEAGDKIHITGESRNVSHFLRSIGAVNYRIGDLLIVGGSRICYYLYRMIEEKGREIKIIEKNHERCEELCELLPKANIVCGDGSDLELLEAEGFGDMDAFIALTGIDEENLIMSMVANYRKVPKIITKVGRFNYLSLLERMGVDTVVNPKLITANHITQYVRAMQNSTGSNVETLHRLVEGRAEAIEFAVQKGTRHLGEPLSKVRFKKNLLVASIVRRDKVIIPHGRDTIENGDRVVVLTTNGSVFTDLNHIFDD